MEVSELPPSRRCCCLDGFFLFLRRLCGDSGSGRNEAILRLRKPVVDTSTTAGPGMEDEARENVGQDEGGGDGDREEEEKCEG